MTRDEFAQSIRESVAAVMTIPGARFYPTPRTEEIEAMITSLWQDYLDDIAMKGDDHAGD